MWRKHKSTDTNKKAEILKEINVLTEEIDKIQAQKKACIRIVAIYKEIKETYEKQLKEKEELNNFIYTSLIKNSKKLR